MDILNTPPDLPAHTEVGTWRAHHEPLPKEKKLEAITRSYSAYNKAIYGIDEKTSKEIMPYVLNALKLHDEGKSSEALEMVQQYYKAINKVTGLGFDPEAVAKSEINWWIVHDQIELGKKTYRDLTKSFADLYSKIFMTDADTLIKACSFKAEATKEHDWAEKLDEKDPQGHWVKAENNLVLFYTELINTLV